MVSIILVNFNSSQHTLNCIKSIFTYTKQETKFEIIVVDNNSKLDDLLNLKKGLVSFEKVTLVESKVNTGFAVGNTLCLLHT